jgi:hypothetical protein
MPGFNKLCRLRIACFGRAQTQPGISPTLCKIMLGL